MSQKPVYLRPNVVIEPLVDGWYAWSHLLSPVTASLNVSKRHTDIMESYLLNPEAHAQAVLNARMRGGPFMDYATQRTDEIQELMNNTRRDRRPLFEFADGIRQLCELLAANAKGFSMESLYEKVPPVVRGYVELHYDLQNNPSFRFFEALLYKSRFYDKAAQRIALWITQNDHRPFCLSTPRLREAEVLDLPLSFDDHGIDELAKMKRKPQSLEYIRKLLGISPQQELLFDSFFTDEAPVGYNRYTGDKVRMRYFGHACILVETREVSILIDPVISYYGYDSDVEHFSDVDLPDEIDFVMITHNHQDHILLETLLPLRHKIRNLIVPRSTGGRLEDPDLRLMFKAIGFDHVIALDEMESINFGDVVITGLPFMGEHCDLNIQTKLCYHVRVSQFSLLFMADSRILEPEVYRNVYSQIGKTDVIFLGMECDGAPLSWLYGPLMLKKITRDQDNSRRLAGSDFEKGMTLVDIFDPREIYVYAMGQEPWLEFISSIKYTDESNPIIQSDKLIKECTRRGLVSERLFGEKEILYEKKRIPVSL